MTCTPAERANVMDQNGSENLENKWFSIMPSVMAVAVAIT